MKNKKLTFRKKLEIDMIACPVGRCWAMPNPLPVSPNTLKDYVFRISKGWKKRFKVHQNGDGTYAIYRVDPGLFDPSTFPHTKPWGDL